ncbi:hypothetical protein AC249_AIPGENE18624, partial [Exaiptasia diaphana]
EDMTDSPDVAEPTQQLTNQPSGTLSEYFASRGDKASARIYANIATDPVVAEISRRKKLNYREMLLVVSGVVGSLDDKIEELERSVGTWRQVSSAMNSPLIAVDRAQPADSISDEVPEQDIDLAEAHWFLKYLTLRNVLGVLVVVLTLSSSFFAFWNKDYRSLIDGAKKRAATAESELLEAKKKIRELEEEKANSGFEIRRLGGLLGAAEDAKEDLRKRNGELESRFTQQVSQSTAQSVDLAKELGDAKALATRFESERDEARRELSRWKGLAQQHERTSGSRATALSAEESKSSTLASERDDAVTAWNQLVGFLGTKKKGWPAEITVRVSDLETQLSELETFTKKIDGMRRNLPD